MIYQAQPISLAAGVHPSTDATPQSTPHYVSADKIRFVDGYPEKIGGWDTFTLSSQFSIQGCPRNVYSYIANNSVNYVIATHTNIYAVNASSLQNITPLETSGSAETDVLSTQFDTLGNNPFSATTGTTVVTVNDTGHGLRDGDVVVFASATTFAGIPAVDLNKSHAITVIDDDSYNVVVATTATSTASGGGSSVTRATRIVEVTYANAFRDGDNVNIADLSSALGGIPTTNINANHIVRDPTSTTFYFDAGAPATSSVSSSGGNITITEEIPDGACDASSGAGYGLGQYGVGAYGVAKSSSTPTYPTIYSIDRFGDLILFTPGSQTGLYSWDLSATLPTLVSNAPTAINYAFVSNNIAVTLGASDTPNRIQWSDQGNLTTWAAAATNQAGQDDIEGAGEFISHASLRGANLLFTREKVFTFRYIGRPFVWEVDELEPGRGLLAQNARVVVNGICYWMGKDNFYRWRGANIEVVPSNTTKETTLKKYVFDNLDEQNSSKAFAWYNVKFNEIWFHYPSQGATECDRIARYNILYDTWTPDTMARTAAEYPNVIGIFPYLMDVNGNILRHENGYNDNGAAMPFSLATRYFAQSGNQSYIGGLYTDNIVTGDISVTINTKNYPSDTPIAAQTFTVPDSGSGADRNSFKVSARYRQYVISGNTVGQNFRMGEWIEEIKTGTPR